MPRESLLPVGVEKDTQDSKIGPVDSDVACCSAEASQLLRNLQGAHHFRLHLQPQLPGDHL